MSSSRDSCRRSGTTKTFGAQVELDRTYALGEDVSQHLGVRDGVNHAVAVKDDPTEVVEPAEEVLGALGGSVLLGELLDGGAIDEVTNRASDVVAKETQELEDVHGAFGGKASGGSLGFGGGVADDTDKLRLVIDGNSH